MGRRLDEHLHEERDDPDAGHCGQLVVVPEREPDAQKEDDESFVLRVPETEWESFYRLFVLDHTEFLAEEGPLRAHPIVRVADQEEAEKAERNREPEPMYIEHGLAANEDVEDEREGVHSHPQLDEIRLGKVLFKRLRLQVRPRRQDIRRHNGRDHERPKPHQGGEVKCFWVVVDDFRKNIRKNSRGFTKLNGQEPVGSISVRRFLTRYS